MLTVHQIANLARLKGLAQKTKKLQINIGTPWGGIVDILEEKFDFVTYLRVGVLMMQEKDIQEEMVKTNSAIHRAL